MQDDAFAQQGEAGAAAHLPFDYLDPGDVALDGAGAVGQGEPGGDGLLVAADAVGEGAQFGLVVGLDGGELVAGCLLALAAGHHLGEAAPADPRAMADAEQAQATATKQERAAATKLTKAQTAAEHADDGHRECQEATRLARDRLDRARQDAATAMQDLTRRSWGSTNPLSEEAFLAGLETACTRLPAAGAGQDDLRASSAAQLLEPAHDLGLALEEATGSAADSAAEAEKAASAASSALEQQQSAHQQAVTRIAAATPRHAGISPATWNPFPRPPCSSCQPIRSPPTPST